MFATRERQIYVLHQYFSKIKSIFTIPFVWSSLLRVPWEDSNMSLSRSLMHRKPDRPPMSEEGKVGLPLIDSCFRL